MLDSLPHIHPDQRSMVTARSASVMSNATMQATTEGQKSKSIKFVYSSEVLRCFQRVLRSLDDKAIGSAGPIRIDNAGRFYKPMKHEVNIVKFPVLYGDLLSMRRRMNTDPEIYVRKKIAECSRNNDADELPKKSSATDDGSKKSRKGAIVKGIDRESTMTSINGALPTIFELTHAQTPRKKVKKRR